MALGQSLEELQIIFARNIRTNLSCLSPIRRIRREPIIDNPAYTIGDAICIIIWYDQWCQRPFLDQ